MSTEISFSTPGFNTFSSVNPFYNYSFPPGNAFPFTLPYVADDDLFGFDPPLSPTATTKPHPPENSYNAFNGRKTLTISERDHPRGEKRKSESSLERNRQAANRCHKKKRAYTKELEECFQTAKSRREILEAEISQLQSEILSLKNQILRHSQCDDDSIKFYLSRMLTLLTGKIAPTLQGELPFNKEESPVLFGSQIHDPQGRLSVDSSTSSELSASMLNAVEQAHWQSALSTVNDNPTELDEDSFWDLVNLS
ncbi:bZIP transcription factor [Aspergillus alliaceus]|uniref:bZIP transcription factor n=1 Tax=Petromyces alliaceus TaxID=209559 RepID=UPI0012A5E232|nr:uncharacterized protein BDW43DRAFT_315584 [Aspergillus alliaceus]KAB8228816.1 hypothetical protein BDW43DRAFT_315584 [Aspergillus alliaceus]